MTASPNGWTGTVIALTADQLATWKRSYHSIPDLTAELQGIDDWPVDHPHLAGRWRSVASKLLNDKHQHWAVDERRRAAVDEPTGPVWC